MSAPAISSAASRRIDYLRLFLVAQVMLGHYAMIGFPEWAALDFARPADLFVGGYRLTTRFGTQAAYVFVALSGYFLVGRLWVIASKARRAELPAFLATRLRKLYPVLVAALLLTLVCDWAGRALFAGEALYRSTASYDMVEALNWRSGIGNLLSLEPTFAGAFGSNAPLWTLGYIVQFYLAGGAIAALAIKSRALAGAAFVLLVALASVWRPEWALLFLGWCGCGLLAAAPRLTRGVGIVAFASGLALFVAANLMPVLFAVVSCGLASAAMIAGLTAGSSDEAARSGDTRWLVRLRAASLPLYAFHFPLAMLLFAAIAPHWELASLGFRLAWPLAAALMAILVTLAWQSLTGLRRATA